MNVGHVDSIRHARLIEEKTECLVIRLRPMKCPGIKAWNKRKRGVKHNKGGYFLSVVQLHVAKEKI